MQAPYLVQRANFKGNNIGSVDDVLSFDYMGSAEFEFGALPKSLKRLTIKAGELSVYEFIHCVSGITGDPIYIISVGEIHDDYLEHILSMASNELRLKESSHLDNIVRGHDFRGEKLNIDSWCCCDAWWDIGNDVMFTFGADNAKRIVDSIVATRDKKKSEKCDGWY